MRRVLLLGATTAALSLGSCALLVDTSGLVATEADDGASPAEGSLVDQRLPSDAGPIIEAGADANVPLPASCQGAAGPGISRCGPDGGENCCSSPMVAGGTFRRSFDGKVNVDGTHPATVSGFRLDRFETTVARFRRFVTAASAGWKPSAGAGKHTHLPGGSLAMVGTAGAEPGWDTAWNDRLASAPVQWSAELTCEAPQNTWTDQPGVNEAKAINCTTWYQAYAFCIWDEGFLPSEAEWNFAAAGGDEQRLFPWSKPPADSTIDCSYANYADYDAATQCNSNVLIPGSFPKGDGRWSHADLLGNVVEWTLDSYLDYVNPCVNGVNLLPATYTSLRGGCFYGIPGSPYVSGRILDMPQRVSRGFGVRCARSP